MYSPVCVNGKYSYSNSCEAHCRHTRTNSGPIISMVRGLCQQQQQQRVMSVEDEQLVEDDIIMPMEDAEELIDRNTITRLWKRMVDVLTPRMFDDSNNDFDQQQFDYEDDEGVENEEESDNLWGQNLCICTREYRPVCTASGVKFSNACMARCALGDKYATAKLAHCH